MGISAGRQHMRWTKKAAWVDRVIKMRYEGCEPVIKAALEDIKGVIINNVARDRHDMNGARFAPLKEATIARKRKNFSHEEILIASGAMIDPGTFHMQTGKFKGVLWHSAPEGARLQGTGQMARVAARSIGQSMGQSTPERERRKRYDYGLAHQRSRQPYLPKRQWWVDPGSKEDGEWRVRILHGLVDYLQKGLVRVRGTQGGVTWVSTTEAENEW